MKKYFTITYEVVGSRKTDTVMMWATNAKEAIEMFIDNDFGNGLKYTEYAIIKIES